MTMKKPSVYQGDEPFVFVSYAHKDSEKVYPILNELENLGFRIWYDNGIHVGHEWTAVLESKILTSTFCLAFVTSTYFNSEVCKDEIELCKNMNKNYSIIYMDRVKDIVYPTGWSLAHSRVQNIYYEKISNEEFYHKLLESPELTLCRNVSGQENASSFSSYRARETKMASRAKTLEPTSMITAPIAGKIQKLSDCPDSKIASGEMGLGVVIIPTNGTLVAPFNGTIISLANLLNSIVIESDSGVKVLIQIGIKTDELNGKFFNSNVKCGDRVRKGQTLIQFDRKSILAAGYLLNTSILITNTNEYDMINVLVKKGSVNAGKDLINVISWNNFSAFFDEMESPSTTSRMNAVPHSQPSDSQTLNTNIFFDDDGFFDGNILHHFAPIKYELLVTAISCIGGIVGLVTSKVLPYNAGFGFVLGTVLTCILLFVIYEEVFDPDDFDERPYFSAITIFISLVGALISWFLFDKFLIGFIICITFGILLTFILMKVRNS